jgi:uncharacterized protein (TIGR00375 family)
MNFRADLHVHSKYSRATSRDLDLEHLAFWAARKGIAVVGTGDCVHPLWRTEIREKLVADGSGLYRLRPEIEAEVGKNLPPACRAPVRFLLSTEISTIYKKGDRTRKVHHLILLPDFVAMERLAAALARVGNIASDGRPILGLDSRDLLEIVLDSGAESSLIPAHIWTPWFSAMGAQSGFESIADCYGDLAEHIFAVETGLSSDPAMNWRISSLDRYRLVSNSDAHSAARLGREATIFSGEPGFSAIRHALKTGEGYVGTVEFFPEEGKYHLDGHRACDVCLSPRETLKLGGRCPVCGKPLTVGVAHRVELLADRAEGVPPPSTAGRVESRVPLSEILSELLGSGPAAKRVEAAYDRVTGQLGAELHVLGEAPLEDIAAVDPLLAEAIGRLRAGRVIRQAGYDGEYGTIRLFAEGELDCRGKGELLFDAPLLRRPRKPRVVAAPAAEEAVTPSDARTAVSSGRSGVLAELDADQAAAAEAVDGPVAVIAGPGSGKTRMLTHRIAHLVAERGVPPGACLAVTFTRRATAELRTRLASLLPEAAGCAVESFHSLGLAILRAHGAEIGLPADFRVATEAERTAALADALGIGAASAAKRLRRLSALKRTGEAGDAADRQALAVLARLRRAQGWVDFDDLIGLAVEVLDRGGEGAAAWRNRFSHICVDEFQDIDEAQYRLIRRLAGPGCALCVIGDPDQAIYGFRGADAACFERFAADFPAARRLLLDRNYRSSGTIVAASAAVAGRKVAGTAMRPTGGPVILHAAADEAAEADFVAASIAAMMGGHDMLAADDKASLGFADFAVLYRTDAQSAALREAFDRAGIPFRKSAPLPILNHAGVGAILAEFGGEGLLAERLAAAERTAAAQEGADIARIAEAKAWLAELMAETADEAVFRERLSLSLETDFQDARGDRVSLLTLHAAKGLEFPAVFVVGVEEGLIPFAFPDAPPDAAAEAEEARLLYVAMTRAEDRLILCRAARRFHHGAWTSPPPSRFLARIPAALIARSVEAARKAKPRQLSLF